MRTIDITSGEEMLYKDFKDGNTVQLRVTVGREEEKDYAKGSKVLVKCGRDQANGKIVSDPLVVTPAGTSGRETISLVVERDADGER